MASRASETWSPASLPPRTQHSARSTGPRVGPLVRWRGEGQEREALLMEQLIGDLIPTLCRADSFPSPSTVFTVPTVPCVQYPRVPYLLDSGTTPTPTRTQSIATGGLHSPRPQGTQTVDRSRRLRSTGSRGTCQAGTVPRVLHKRAAASMAEAVCISDIALISAPNAPRS